MEADTAVDVVPAAPATPAASADFPAVVDSPGIAPADESAGLEVYAALRDCRYGHRDSGGRFSGSDSCRALAEIVCP